MAKRISVNTKNKTSRSKKTKKRLAIKKERLATTKTNSRKPKLAKTVV